MKKFAFLALAAALGLASPAVAEESVNPFGTDCTSKLERAIAVPSSTGHTVYLAVNTRTTACAVNWQDDPLFQSTSGGDSGGSDGGTGNGGGEGCGGGDGGNGGGSDGGSGGGTGGH